jgi:hypothetical protein
MFQRSRRPFRALLNLIDEMLSDAASEAAPHPHRRPLRWQPARRPGSVAPRPAQCISPVRTTVSHRRGSAVER